MSIQITASMLYDLLQCSYRVKLDSNEETGKRDKVNAFVQMLWEKGSQYEREVMEALKQEFLDLSIYGGDEKEKKTTEAMEASVPLIYSARLKYGELLGDPDLLRYEDGGYVAIDIKSGAGLDGASEDLSKPKKTYAVQLALYTDILEKKGFSPGRYAYIWDIHGEEVLYEFSSTLGPKTPTTLWSFYLETLTTATLVVTGKEETKPAYSSGLCKLCYWNSHCMEELEASDDLTLIPELGRSKRDVMSAEVSTIGELANIDIESFKIGKKTVFPGIGQPSLVKFSNRAKLIKSDNPQPYLKTPVDFPNHKTELFFDIEVDPMRDLCYLHGFIERNNGDTLGEKFIYFFADNANPESEKAAFQASYKYMQEHMPCAIYYYSKYERTIYRKLQQKYPDVCTALDIEALFDPAFAIDLYFDVVLKHTEWPTKDYSIKTLARFLGFDWRDTDPSGAASIEWFDQWVTTEDLAIKERIIIYNEDDCIATRVLLDGLKRM